MSTAASPAVSSLPEMYQIDDDLYLFPSPEEKAKFERMVQRFKTPCADRVQSVVDFRAEAGLSGLPDRRMLANLCHAETAK